MHGCRRGRTQLAHALLARGAGPDTPVGVCLERSLLMPTALLGILKAGAGYVPLDPSYPQSRRDFMLADAGVRLMLTQQSLASQIPASVETLCLDTEWPAIAEPSRYSPACLRRRPVLHHLHVRVHGNA